MRKSPRPARTRSRQRKSRRASGEFGSAHEGVTGVTPFSICSRTREFLACPPTWFPAVKANKPATPSVAPVAPASDAAARLAELERSEQLLHAIIEGTSAVAGQEFFRSLVKHLAEGLGVRWVFVAECLPNLRARSLAFFQDHNFGEDFEYTLPGTPCMKVAEGRVCHVPDRLAELFPEDKGMIDMGTVSYLGVPLRGSDGRVIGHLVTFDDKPMPSDPLALSVLETFAARAAVELERDRAFKDLERRKQESDERYRDLFERSEER